MATRYKLHSEAEQEAIEAEEWYFENADAQVSEDFTEALRDCIRKILEYPQGHPLSRDNLRCCVIKRFPYKLIYSFESDFVFILAVAHAKRKPGYWSERRKE